MGLRNCRVMLKSKIISNTKAMFTRVVNGLFFVIFIFTFFSNVFDGVCGEYKIS